LSGGHAATFDWDVVAPSWISSFVPNLETEFGLALMFDPDLLASRTEATVMRHTSHGAA